MQLKHKIASLKGFAFFNTIVKNGLNNSRRFRYTVITGQYTATFFLLFELLCDIEQVRDVCD